jgi:hypothetical protein
VRGYSWTDISLRLGTTRHVIGRLLNLSQVSWRTSVAHQSPEDAV